MRFPRAQFDAIQRGKADDSVAIQNGLLSNHTLDLQQKEKATNNLYWSLFHRGRCEDKLLAEYLMHERNALRVRISRLIKRSSTAVDSLPSSAKVTRGEVRATEAGD